MTLSERMRKYGEYIQTAWKVLHEKVADTLFGFADEVAKLEAELIRHKRISNEREELACINAKLAMDWKTERDALVLKLIEVLDVCIARGEKLGYEDEDYRATRKEVSDGRI